MAVKQFVFLGFSCGILSRAFLIVATFGTVKFYNDFADAYFEDKGINYMDAPHTYCSCVIFYRKLRQHRIIGVGVNIQGVFSWSRIYFRR